MLKIPSEQGGGTRREKGLQKGVEGDKVSWEMGTFGEKDDALLP